METNEFIYLLFFLYCTGYLYSYPFLSVDTGIHVTDNFIQPLYKQVFNIDHPTMAFVGVPTSASNFMMFDLQVVRIKKNILVYDITFRNKGIVNSLVIMFKVLFFTSLFHKRRFRRSTK